MNTLYVRCQTKDYILDIVAARAGMRINKVNSDNIIQKYLTPGIILLTMRRIRNGLWYRTRRMWYRKLYLTSGYQKLHNQF